MQEIHATKDHDVYGAPRIHQDLVAQGHACHRKPVVKCMKPAGTQAKTVKTFRLIARVERTNGWQLADDLGDETPKNIQDFIARSQWAADEVRDDLQRYAVEQLGHADRVLVIDETGFLKK